MYYFLVWYGLVSSDVDTEILYLGVVFSGMVCHGVHSVLVMCSVWYVMVWCNMVFWCALVV